MLASYREEQAKELLAKHLELEDRQDVSENSGSNSRNNVNTRCRSRSNSWRARPCSILKEESEEELSSYLRSASRQSSRYVSLHRVCTYSLSPLFFLVCGMNFSVSSRIYATLGHKPRKACRPLPHVLKCCCPVFSRFFPLHDFVSSPRSASRCCSAQLSRQNSEEAVSSTSFDSDAARPTTFFILGGPNANSINPTTPTSTMNRFDDVLSPIDEREGSEPDVRRHLRRSVLNEIVDDSLNRSDEHAVRKSSDSCLHAHQQLLRSASAKRLLRRFLPFGSTFPYTLHHPFFSLTATFQKFFAVSLHVCRYFERSRQSTSRPGTSRSQQTR